MQINPPGIPQDNSNQAKIHTFIGDTPEIPDDTAVDIEDTNFSAVRAYHRSAGNLPAFEPDSANEDDFDVRKANPRTQARWVTGANR